MRKIPDNSSQRFQDGCLSKVKKMFHFLLGSKLLKLQKRAKMDFIYDVKVDTNK